MEPTKHLTKLSLGPCTGKQVGIVVLYTYQRECEAML
jgi:hypothetical protein